LTRATIAVSRCATPSSHARACATADWNSARARAAIRPAAAVTAPSRPLTSPESAERATDGRLASAPFAASVRAAVFVAIQASAASTAA
jgi:hypothetical protein